MIFVMDNASPLHPTHALDRYSSMRQLAAAFVGTARVYCAGGEGSRRLSAALESQGIAVEDPQDNAAATALGVALASGRPTWVLASGEATSRCVRALLDAARLTVPLRVLVLSHGEDEGETLPSDDRRDLSAFLQLESSIEHWRASDAQACATIVSHLSKSATADAVIGPAVVSIELRASALTLRAPRAEASASAASDARSDTLKLRDCEPLVLSASGCDRGKADVVLIATHDAAHNARLLATHANALAMNVVVAEPRLVSRSFATRLAPYIATNTTLLICDPATSVPLDGPDGPLAAQLISMLYRQGVLANLRSSDCVQVRHARGTFEQWRAWLSAVDTRANALPVEHSAWIIATPRIKLSTLNQVLASCERAGQSVCAELREPERAHIRWLGECPAQSGKALNRALIVEGLPVTATLALAPTQTVCETLQTDPSESDEGAVARSAAAVVLHWIAQTLRSDKAGILEQTRK
jgi:hypothetical protein